MYYSLLEIKRTPQTIIESKDFSLGRDARFTLEILRGYGVTEENSFDINTNEDGEMDLTVYHPRLETQEELDKRIKREEQYNKNAIAFKEKQQELIKKLGLNSKK